MSVEQFAEWAIVEIMGHRVFAGFVTEQLIAGRGFIRIDVPEDRTVSYAIVPAFTKVFGTDAVFSISPCSEEAAMRVIAGCRLEVMKGAKLLTPPNPVPAFTSPTDEDLASLDEALLAEAKFRTCDHGPYSICDNCARPDEVDVAPATQSPSEFRIPAHPIEDAGFVDPIDNEPF